MGRIRTGEIPHCDCKRKIAELEKRIRILATMYDRSEADCPKGGLTNCVDYDHDCIECIIAYSEELAQIYNSGEK